MINLDPVDAHNQETVSVDAHKLSITLVDA